MLTETGRIVAVEADRLWVETINRSTCGSCAAEKGCGQSLLARWAARSSYLPVWLDGRDADDFQLNDVVTLGIPEDVVVKSSLLVYCLPLVGILAGVWLAATIWPGENGAIAGALSGLLGGGVLVKLHAYRTRRDRRLRPVLLGKALVARDLPSASPRSETVGSQ